MVRPVWSPNELIVIFGSRSALDAQQNKLVCLAVGLHSPRNASPNQTLSILIFQHNFV
jgi:hypothetical protein